MFERKKVVLPKFSKIIRRSLCDVRCKIDGIAIANPIRSNLLQHVTTVMPCNNVKIFCLTLQRIYNVSFGMQFSHRYFITALYGTTFQLIKYTQHYVSAEVCTSASWSAIPLVAERQKNSGIAVLKK